MFNSCGLISWWEPRDLFEALQTCFGLWTAISDLSAHSSRHMPVSWQCPLTTSPMAFFPAWQSIYRTPTALDQTNINVPAYSGIATDCWTASRSWQRLTARQSTARRGMSMSLCWYSNWEILHFSHKHTLCNFKYYLHSTISAQNKFLLRAADATC